MSCGYARTLLRMMGKIIAGNVGGWSDVTEIAETCFSADAYQTTHAASQGSVARITFPVMLAVYAANVPHVLLDAFPSSLALLTGHVYVYAWYWAVFEAINTNNYGLIAALWQAGLSVTIHCRVGMNESERAVLSIAMSESRKASARLSDGFMGFALKALLIVKQSSATSKLAVLNQLGVRFNGSPVSKAMLTGILIFDDKMTPASKQALVNIEEKFGKEPLTSGYVKLTRISGICSNNASGMTETAADLMEYVIEFLWWALQYELVAPGNVTTEYLDKMRDGTLGVVHIALGRKHIYNIMSAWVEDLGCVPGAASLASDLGLIMRHFSTYARFLEAFPLTTTHAASQGSGVEIESGAQFDDPVDEMKEKYKNKSAHVVIDFLYDLLSCVYDKDIGKALKDESAKVKDIKWLDVEALTPLREIFRLMGVHNTVITAVAGGPPGEGARTLKRYKSEAEADPTRDEELRKERSEAWRQAQVARKKFVHVGFLRAASKQQLQGYFEKTPVYNFVGKACESHRVFVFNSELFAESRTTPWSSAAELPSTADLYLEWIASQTAPSDVLLVADGRSRQCRRKIENALEKARHLHEAWIVYKSSGRLGRRVAFAADNKEMVLVSMPVARTQLVVAPRDSFTHAGEESTHETTYTGVDAAPWGSLPLIQASDKEKIMGHEPAAPQGGVFDTSVGQPLFWQERKSVSCLKALLADVQAKTVFDLTPGSGACGRAAMEMGLVYACVTRNAEHSSWLQNIFDRQALRGICESNGPLHEQDLSQCIQEHFSEVLDQLNDMDAVADTVLEDGVDVL